MRRPLITKTIKRTKENTNAADNQYRNVKLSILIDSAGFG
jgi:hypothetical protein